MTARARARRKTLTVAEAIEAAAPPGFEHLRVTEEGLLLQHFSKTFLRGTQGQFAGLPFELPPFEVLLASALLEGRYTGEPRYREGFVGWPRGNGKSGFGSVLAWEGLIVEGVQDPGAAIYLGASTREQARIMFREMAEMRLASPLLSSWTKAYRDAIEVPETGALLQVLSGDRASGAAHGLRPTRTILDELHAMRNPELYYALRSAAHKRPRSLQLGITTAGFDLNTIAGELYLKGLAGRDPRFFFLWLELTDAEVAKIGELRAAASTVDEPELVQELLLEAGTIAERVNPAPWVTGPLLAEQLGALPFAVFLRLHGNKWTRTEELWLPPGAWDACADETLAYDPELPAWIGLDQGLRNDTTAIVVVQPQGEERFGVWAWVLGVHADTAKPAPPCHELMAGDRIEHALIEQRLLQVARGEGFPDGRLAGLQELRLVGGDPWKFSRSIELLQDEGLVAIEFPQTNARMAPASQRLYDEIVQRRLVHDGDPVLAAHVAAATAKETERGWRLWKLRSRSPMDGAIALAIGVDLALSDAGGSFQLRFLGDEEDVAELEAIVSGGERRLVLLEAFIEDAEPIAWEELEREDAVRLRQELVDAASRARARGHEELAERLLRERDRSRQPIGET